MENTMKDRKALIRLASSMSKGDPDRRVILAELQKRGGGEMGDIEKWIPSRVRNQLPAFARILKDVQLETRALAGSVDPEDAYYDIIEMLESGKGPRNEPVEKDKRTFNKLQDMDSDMWFEDYLDHVVDSVEEDWGLDEDDLRNKVQQELSLQLVKAGILGKRAKKRAKTGATAPRWATQAIERVLRGRSHTGSSWRDTLAEIDQQVRQKAARLKNWDRWILALGEAMEGTPLWNAKKLDALWDDVLVAGDQNYLQESGEEFTEWEAGNLEKYLFEHVAKL